MPAAAALAQQERVVVWINEGLPGACLTGGIFSLFYHHPSSSLIYTHPHFSSCNKEVKFILSETLMPANKRKYRDLASKSKREGKNVWIMFTCAKSHHRYFLHPPTTHRLHSTDSSCGIAVRVKGVNHQINYNICSIAIAFEKGWFSMSEKVFAISKYHNEILCSTLFNNVGKIEIYYESVSLVS